MLSQLFHRRWIFGRIIIAIILLDLIYVLVVLLPPVRPKHTTLSWIRNVMLMKLCPGAVVSPSKRQEPQRQRRHGGQLYHRASAQ